MVDQGAGYLSPPTITFLNDPREGQNATTVGYNAAAVAVLTGSGTITALLCLDHGTPIAFSAGSATTIPTFSNGTSGVTGSLAWIVGIDQPTAANSTVLNVAVQRSLVKGRNASLYIPIAGGVLTAYTTAVVQDGGIYQGTPLLVIMNNQITTPGGATGALATMGYFVSDTSYLTQL